MRASRSSRLSETHEKGSRLCNKVALDKISKVADDMQAALEANEQVDIYNCLVGLVNSEPDSEDGIDFRAFVEAVGDDELLKEETCDESARGVGEKLCTTMMFSFAELLKAWQHCIFFGRALQRWYW